MFAEFAIPLCSTTSRFARCVASERRKACLGVEVAIVEADTGADTQGCSIESLLLIGGGG